MWGPLPCPPGVVFGLCVKGFDVFPFVKPSAIDSRNFSACLGRKITTFIG